MLTDLQTRKLTRMFNAYDADHSGYLEFADFETQFNNLAHMHRIAADSPEYDELQSAYRAAWEQIRRFGDADRDERVVLDEWLAYCSDVVQSPDTFEHGIVTKSRHLVKVDDVAGKVMENATPDGRRLVCANHTREVVGHSAAKVRHKRKTNLADG